MAASRWKAAQEYEKGYWVARAEGIDAGTGSSLRFYQWRADQLGEWLNGLGLTVGDGTARVVEVGSGPVGLAAFFPAQHRLIVDPLEEEYRGIPSLVAYRNPTADYRAARGEELPAADGEFDLAVIENCIDHVADPTAVIREIRRTLRSRGFLYVTVNCRSTVGYYVHRLLSRLRLDPGHPHTFTPPRLHRLLEAHGFTILGSKLGSLDEARRTDLASPSSRARLKGRLGVSEYLASVVAQRME